MKITEQNIEFNNVSRATTSINDNNEKTITVKNYSFTNVNSKGDFKQISSVSDLEGLHDFGKNIAKNTFAMMNE